MKFQPNDAQSQSQSQSQDVHASLTDGTSGVRPPPRDERDRPGTPDKPASPDHPDVGNAHTKPHGKFSWIWMIPIVAGALVVYLAHVNYAKHGPTIAVTFSTADGLQVDQTLVKHKAVGLGTVEEIELAKDMSHVTVKIQMDATAKDIMTDHARFWVVRPRFSAGNLSGLETLVSGAYIEVDPGAPGGKKTTTFTGLEQPPGRTSDEPGHVFLLKADRLGSLSVGAPVYYRDVEVGEVLSYDLGDGLGPVTLRVFVRAPYDKFVHPQTRFWNASGISIAMGSEGMHIELESIQSVISGGLAFETPRINEQDPPADDNAQFHLFQDKAKADSAFYQVNIHYVTYFETSVQGLSNGAPVQLFGVQVGSVTDVKLVYDEDKQQMVARVAFDLQPERILSKTEPANAAMNDALKMPFVDNSVHVVLESTSFITGAKDLSLAYKASDGSKSAVSLAKEGDATVLPSQGGGCRQPDGAAQRRGHQGEQDPLRGHRQERRRHDQELQPPGQPGGRPGHAGARAAARDHGQGRQRDGEGQRRARRRRLRTELAVSTRPGAADQPDERRHAQHSSPRRLPRSSPRSSHPRSLGRR